VGSGLFGVMGLKKGEKNSEVKMDLKTCELFRNRGKVADVVSCISYIIMEEAEKEKAILHLGTRVN